MSDVTAVLRLSLNRDSMLEDVERAYMLGDAGLLDRYSYCWVRARDFGSVCSFSTAYAISFVAVCTRWHGYFHNKMYMSMADTVRPSVAKTRVTTFIFLAKKDRPHIIYIGLMHWMQFEA